MDDSIADEIRRQLAMTAAFEELQLWRNLAPLLPFAVHRDHRTERAIARIPRQRPPVEPMRPRLVRPVFFPAPRRPGARPGL